VEGEGGLFSRKNIGCLQEDVNGSVSGCTHNLRRMCAVLRGNVESMVHVACGIMSDI